MGVDLEELINSVKVPSGCTFINLVQPNRDALEFVEKVTELYRNGTKISPTKVGIVLKDTWGIHCSTRRISDHLRGDCACQKKQK